MLPKVAEAGVVASPTTVAPAAGVPALTAVPPAPSVSAAVNGRVAAASATTPRRRLIASITWRAVETLSWRLTVSRLAAPS